MAFDPKQFLDPEMASQVGQQAFNPDGFASPEDEQVYEEYTPGSEPADAEQPSGLRALQMKLLNYGLAHGVDEAAKSKAVVQGAGQGLLEQGQGAKQLALDVGERTGLLPSGTTEDYTKEVMDARAQDQGIPERDRRYFRAGEIAGGLLPYMAVPGGATGGILRRVGTGALSGSLVGATQFAGPSDSRLRNSLLGGMIGGSFPAMQELYRGARGLLGRVTGSRKMAAAAFKKRLTPEEIAKSGRLQQAADDLDIPLTPGEATGSKSTKAFESRIDVTPKSQIRVKEFLQKRERILKGQSRKLIDDVVPEGDEVAAKTAEDLYARVKDAVVPKDVLKTVMDDPILAKAYARAKQSPEFGMQKFQQGSVGELNELKKFLDYRIGSSRVQSGSVNRNMVEAKNKLLDILDNVSPEYKGARAISQRIIQKRTLTDAIQEIPLQPGQSGPTVSQIYQKLFKTPANQKYFLESIKSSGGNVKQAANFIRVLNAIDDSPLNKLVTKNTQVMGKLESAQGVTGIATGLSRHFLTRRHQRQLLDLALDPKWASRIEALSKVSSKDKMMNGLNALLARQATIEAAEQSNQSPEGIPADDPSAPPAAKSIEQRLAQFQDPDAPMSEEGGGEAFNGILPALKPSNVPVKSPVLMIRPGAADVPLREDFIQAPASMQNRQVLQGEPNMPEDAMMEGEPLADPDKPLSFDPEFLQDVQRNINDPEQQPQVFDKINNYVSQNFKSPQEQERAINEILKTVPAQDVASSSVSAQAPVSDEGQLESVDTILREHGLQNEGASLKNAVTQYLIDPENKQQMLDSINQFVSKNFSTPQQQAKFIQKVVSKVGSKEELAQKRDALQRAKKMHKRLFTSDLNKPKAGKGDKQKSQEEQRMERLKDMPSIVKFFMFIMSALMGPQALNKAQRDLMKAKKLKEKDQPPEDGEEKMLTVKDLRAAADAMGSS